MVLLSNCAAVAVEAAVSGTGDAGRDQVLSEGFEGAMDADGGIGDRDVVRVGEGVERGFVEVDLLQDRGVVRVERWQDAGDAFADDVTGEVVWFGGGFEFGGPLGEG